MITRKRFSILSIGAGTLGLCAFAATDTHAQIGSSGDDGFAGTVTQHQSNSNTFDIVEDVFLDPAAGPWTLELTNFGNKNSGQKVQINETIVNAGAEAWGKWVQSILSTTGGGGGSSRPGFLFDNQSIAVQADYGSGLVALAEGVEYTLNGIEHSDTGGVGNDGYSEVEITFASGFEIDAGDTLFIQKQIYEVFGDSDTWLAGEIAEVAAYPVPEPTSLALLGLGGLLAARRRRC